MIQVGKVVPDWGSSGRVVGCGLWVVGSGGEVGPGWGGEVSPGVDVGVGVGVTEGSGPPMGGVVVIIGVGDGDGVADGEMEGPGVVVGVFVGRGVEVGVGEGSGPPVGGSVGDGVGVRVTVTVTVMGGVTDGVVVGVGDGAASQLRAFSAMPPQESKSSSSSTFQVRSSCHWLQMSPRPLVKVCWGRRVWSPSESAQKAVSQQSRNQWTETVWVEVFLTKNDSGWFQLPETGEIWSSPAA